MTVYMIGYARVSTLHQDEALQHDALREAGCDQMEPHRARVFATGRQGNQLPHEGSHSTRGDRYGIAQRDAVKAPTRLSVR